MLNGDNGIIQKATSAKNNTEKAQIIEQAQTDIIVRQIENEGKNITKEQLIEILNKYFEPTDVSLLPDEISTEHDIALISLKEKLDINLSEIFKGKFLIIDDLVNKAVKDLEIGDYIKYGDKLTVKNYETNSEKTGFYKNQIFETDNNMLWRVMNKKDNGNVEIVAISNMLAKTDNNDEKCLYLVDDIGFFNAEEVLNNMCEYLYSNPLYGEGRSINVEDINRLSGVNNSRI